MCCYLCIVYGYASLRIATKKRANEIFMPFYKSWSAVMDDSKKMLHLQSAQHRLFIKNGLVVNHDESKFVDVYIEESIIKQVGNHLIIPGGKKSDFSKNSFVYYEHFWLQKRPLE